MLYVYTVYVNIIHAHSVYVSLSNSVVIVGDKLMYCVFCLNNSVKYY